MGCLLDSTHRPRPIASSSAKDLSSEPHCTSVRLRPGGWLRGNQEGKGARSEEKEREKECWSKDGDLGEGGGGQKRRETKKDGEEGKVGSGIFSFSFWRAKSRQAVASCPAEGGRAGLP